MNCKYLIAGIVSLFGVGAAIARGAAYDHSHMLIESPAVLLCLFAVVGVIAAISMSSEQTLRAIPIEIDQRHKRISEKNH